MILITGHKGFIGTHLTRWVPNFIGIDLKDGMNLLTCNLPNNFFEGIYHLAAQSSVEASWSDPLHDLDNIRITARLHEKYPHTKIVYANSCASIDRDTPYGFSKGTAGDYLLKFHEKTVNLIFPNIYGEGSKSVVDIFKNKKKVDIYGDGTHTRDYVHIHDIVKGLLLAREWKPGTYSMGTGINTSVNELAKGKKITYLSERKETAHVKVPNTTPNWKPEIMLEHYL